MTVTSGNECSVILRLVLDKKNDEAQTGFESGNRRNERGSLSADERQSREERLGLESLVGAQGYPWTPAPWVHQKSCGRIVAPSWAAGASKREFHG